MAKKKKVPRKPKEVVQFDEKSMKDFCTGFRKRKNQRRKVAADQLEQVEKRQKKKERREKRAETLKYLSDDEDNAAVEDTNTSVSQFNDNDKVTTVTTTILEVNEDAFKPNEASESEAPHSASTVTKLETKDVSKKSTKPYRSNRSRFAFGRKGKKRKSDFTRKSSDFTRKPFSKSMSGKKRRKS